MKNLTYNDLNILVQTVYTIITFLGIMLSLFMSIKSIKVSESTLKEIKKDRDLNNSPYLIFDCGGYRMDIEFVKDGKKIPGIDPNYVEKVFNNLPDDAESVRLVEHNSAVKFKPVQFGHLRNYGCGSALDVNITWVPQLIWIGKEKFEIDRLKLNEPQCCFTGSRCSFSRVNTSAGIFFVI